MITVYSGTPGSKTIFVEHIDTGKEARRVARDKAPKAGATRKIEDKQKADLRDKLREKLGAS